MKWFLFIFSSSVCDGEILLLVIFLRTGLEGKTKALVRCFEEKGWFLVMGKRVIFAKQFRSAPARDKEQWQRAATFRHSDMAQCSFVSASNEICSAV